MVWWRLQNTHRCLSRPRYFFLFGLQEEPHVIVMAFRQCTLLFLRRREWRVWIIVVPGFDSQREMGIFLFSTASRPALGPTQPPIQWKTGLKQPGPKAYHSPPSSTEVKNGLFCTSTPNTSTWFGAYLGAGTTLTVTIIIVILRAFHIWCLSIDGGYRVNDYPSSKRTNFMSSEEKNVKIWIHITQRNAQRTWTE
jgi:hypothetical protein